MSRGHGTAQRAILEYLAAHDDGRYWIRLEEIAQARWPDSRSGLGDWYFDSSQRESLRRAASTLTQEGLIETGLVYHCSENGGGNQPTQAVRLPRPNESTGS